MQDDQVEFSRADREGFVPPEVLLSLTGSRVAQSEKPLSGNRYSSLYLGGQSTGVASISARVDTIGERDILARGSLASGTYPW